MRPRLLVLELWGLGDLVIATPFLRAAAEKFEVTLLAKPYALELRPRLWPEVEVVPFTAPWTAFRDKYQLWSWPWRELFALRRRLAAQQFDFAVSARWDPRDHLALKLAGARERLGFSRLKSRRYLTQELARPDPLAHRYEYWRAAATALGLKLPERSELFVGADTRPLRGHDDPATGPLIPAGSPGGGEGVRRTETGKQVQGEAAQIPSPQPSPRMGGARESKTGTPDVRPPVVLIHTGARLPLRVWPLENFAELVTRLRQKNVAVQVACDEDQLDWWRSRGENATAPRTVTELFDGLDRAGLFIGNDSGPGHLAAACGLPTFTLFGPQLHEWFAPLHPAGEVVEGRACPYKPCSDYCRFAEPFCLRGITVAEVWPRVEKFVERHLK